MEAVYPEVCAADLSKIRGNFGERQIDDPHRFVDIALVDAKVASRCRDQTALRPSLENPYRDKFVPTTDFVGTIM